MICKPYKLLIPVLIVAFVFMSGCTYFTTPETVTDTGLQGELKLDGSTTVYPIAEHAARVFMEKNPGVMVDVQQSSTGEGLEKFLAGKTDISDATRPPKDTEYNIAKSKGMNLHMTAISYDGVVLIVHPDNPLTELTADQIKGIYFDGSITNWNQLTNGKKSGKINIYNTDPKISGTAELFNKKITDSDTTPYVKGTTQVHPTPDMIPTIMNDPDGIAYTPLKWVNSSVKLLNIDGVTPSAKTITDGSYPLSRQMYMITDGTPDGLTKEFINFILSGEGQEIVEEEGFIPLV